MESLVRRVLSALFAAVFAGLGALVAPRVMLLARPYGEYIILLTGIAVVVVALCIGWQVGAHVTGLRQRHRP